MRRFTNRIGVVMTVAMLLIAAGCSSNRSLREGEYRTVGNDLRRDSEQARRHNDRAVELIEKNDWTGAERALKTALESDVTFGPAHNNLGNVYFHQGKLYLAAWEFQYAIKSMPFQPEPRNNLGLVMEAAGKLDDAVQCYDEAGEMQRDNPVFAGNGARARLRRGDHDARVADLLNKVVLAAEKPEWVDWARENLLLLRTADSQRTTSP